MHRKSAMQSTRSNKRQRGNLLSLLNPTLVKSKARGRGRAESRDRSKVMAATRPQSKVNPATNQMARVAMESRVTAPMAKGMAAMRTVEPKAAEIVAAKVKAMTKHPAPAIRKEEGVVEAAAPQSSKTARQREPMAVAITSQRM